MRSRLVSLAYEGVEAGGMGMMMASRRCPMAPPST